MSKHSRNKLVPQRTKNNNLIIERQEEEFEPSHQYDTLPAQLERD
jgi:hypothetical protein